MKICGYVIHEILLYVTLFFSVLFIILLGNFASDFLDKAVDGYIGLSTVIKLLYFIAPSIVLLVLPMSIFGGIFVAFRQLCLKNELLAMFSFGVSWKRLFFYASVPVVLLTPFTMILGFIIVPNASSNFQMLYQNAAVKSIKYLQRRKFYNVGENQEILLNDNKETKKKEILMIIFGKGDVSVTFSPDYLVEKLNSGNFLSMNNGWNDVLNEQNKAIKKVNFKSEMLRLDSGDTTLNVTTAARSTEKLFYDRGYKSEIELRWRLFTGFLPLIALFFVFPFCSGFTRTNSYFSTILAIVCFFSFCVLSSLIKNMLLLSELPLWCGFEVLSFFVFFVSTVWLFLKDRG
ncbi:MAG: hypothetical protein A3F13_05260 [Gammaproteobacteria bacterium RIFCSPHIGHO2_12_FULL_40_19]|nr:MAG: hypothetical protein A3F13_05260 [Gammaproteobacteria bacterium RIFCSPHIGHO2_12_FULL_40_19]